MLIIALIDIVAVAIICAIVLTKGMESILPFVAFAFVLLPIEALIPAGFDLTAQRLMLGVLTVLFLFVGGSKTGADQAASGAKAKLPLKGLIFAHVTWCLVSTANSIVPMMSVKKLLSVICEYYILYVIFAKSITRVQTIHRILAAMVLAIGVCSVFGTVEAYNGWDVMSLLPAVNHRFSGMNGDNPGEADRDIRVHATFGHPILFGAALATAIIIALWLLTQQQKFTKKAFIWFGLMLFFVNIYKTSSRGPWLDAILGGLLLLTLGGKRLRSPLLALGVLSVFVMIIRPGVRDTIVGIYENSFDMNTTTGSSYQYRYDLQTAAVKKLKESTPRAIWGYGLESFYDLQVTGNFLGKEHVFLSADDSWVELMVETGFVGLLLIMLLLFKPMFAAWRDFRRAPAPDRYLSLVFFTTMLVFYFQMYSVGMYTWGQNGYMLWILIALSACYPRVRPVPSSTAELSEYAGVTGPGGVEPATIVAG